MACPCMLNNNNVEPVQTLATLSECNYTLEQVTEWLAITICVRDNGRYSEINLTKFQVNLYIGILISAQNYKNNICYFYKELQEIENFILVVQTNNLC